jgi:GntR family transcriptional repressor for pyruvate dehydrogenase complex
MEMITNYLLAGELRPGDQLPTETEFARRLGVGRNSVREAIKMLSSIGVVEIHRGSGTFIAKSMSSAILSPLILSLAFEQGTSRELIEMRILLDTWAAELALDRLNEQKIERLEQANQRLREAEEAMEKAGSADYHQLRDLDLGFHRVLLEVSENRLLAKIGQAIYTLFFASMEKAMRQDPLQAYENHRLVIDALKKRDAELVRQGVRASLSRWIEEVKASKRG